MDVIKILLLKIRESVIVLILKLFFEKCVFNNLWKKGFSLSIYYEGFFYNNLFVYER